MTSRTRRCDQAVIEGRLRKAHQFWDAAGSLRDLADDEAEVRDAYVTLCVHAGIAAADAVCCLALGKHARGEDHRHALDLLASVRPDGKALSNSLRALLQMKTKAGYDARPMSAKDRDRAARHAERLVAAARDRRTSSA